MNIKWLKYFLGVIFIIFTFLLLEVNNIVEEKQTLIDKNFEISKFLLHLKDRQKELVKIEFSNIVNYDNINDLHKQTKKELTQLIKEYPSDAQLQEMQKFLIQENSYIERYLKENSIVLALINYIETMYISYFMKPDMIGTNKDIIQKIKLESRSLVDLSYPIKYANQLNLNNYKNHLEQLQSLKSDDKKVLKYSKKFLKLTNKIYNSTLKLQKNQTQIEAHEKKINNFIITIEQNTHQEYLKYIYIITVIKAIAFGFAIIILIITLYLLRVTNKSRQELKNLNNLLEYKVEEKTKDYLIQRDKAEQNSKSKSEFLANMSHEIRTPLNAIIGFIDILKDESVGREKSLKYLHIVESSSQNLLKILEDILDFSKIEIEKLKISEKNFNTNKEFSITTQLFHAICLQKDIILSLNIDKEVPKVLYGDSLRIKQVISNLISNAVKFTPKNKNIKVEINYKDNYLNVSVKDEGIGIAKDKLSHIFEAFNQEDGSTTRKYGGTGLGLSISNALVKLLGGELKVKSEQGKGSEFSFSVPVCIGEEKKSEEKTKQTHNFTNKKILLVEDNKANQMFMEIICKKLNLKFAIANDGVEAIELYKQNHAKYDAIIMDENMPNMNGIEATKHILKFENENNLKHTPVIALTANAIKGDRERFLKSGMDEYLTKPIKKSVLQDVLGRFL